MTRMKLEEAIALLVVIFFIMFGIFLFLFTIGIATACVLKFCNWLIF